MTDKNKSEIRMAIGHASMCWNPIPSGIFDEQEANKVADNLIKVLDESPSDSEAATIQAQEERIRLLEEALRLVVWTRDLTDEKTIVSIRKIASQALTPKTNKP